MDLAAKLSALEIICRCPLWPRREMLSSSGVALFDAMVAEAKEYALTSLEAEPKAFEILGRWGWLVNRFIDETYIGDDENNHRLLAVFLHYADVLADWSRVER